MNRRLDPAAVRRLERNAFFILLGLLTIALAWVIGPFYGAVFWGAVLALMFEPLYRRLLARFRGRRNLAALATLAIILLIVILPLAARPPDASAAAAAPSSSPSRSLPLPALPSSSRCPCRSFRTSRFRAS